MTHKEQLPQFQLALAHMDESAEASKQTISALSPDEIAEVVAEDRARRRRHDNHEDIEVMRASGIDRGCQQHGLARKRDARALDGDEDQHRPIAWPAPSPRRMPRGRYPRCATSHRRICGDMR